MPLVGFVVYLYKNSHPTHNAPEGSSINNLCVQHHLTYSFTNRNHQDLSSNHELFELNDKFTVGTDFSPVEGHLILHFQLDAGITIEVSCYYRIVDTINASQNIPAFFEEMHRIIERFKLLNDSDTAISRLNHFINPHLAGLRYELDRLDHPFMGSYTLDSGRFLHFAGISNRSVMENTSNSTLDDTGQVSLHVKINNQSYEITYHADRDVWFFNSNDTNVPSADEFP